MLARVLVEPGEQLLVHGGDAPRRGLQTFAVRVLADGEEQLLHRRARHAADRRSPDSASLIGHLAVVDVQVAQVPVALGDVEPVADHEIRRDA